MINQSDNRAHVVPVDDTFTHVLSENCWCFPLVKDEGGKETVVHNAQDTREKYERITGRGIEGKPWITILEDMTVRNHTIHNENEDT